MQSQHQRLDRFCLGIPLQLQQALSRNQNTSSLVLSHGRHNPFPKSYLMHESHQLRYGNSWWGRGYSSHLERLDAQSQSFAYPPEPAHRLVLWIALLQWVNFYQTVFQSESQSACHDSPSQEHMRSRSPWANGTSRSCLSESLARSPRIGKDVSSRLTGYVFSFSDIDFFLEIISGMFCICCNSLCKSVEAIVLFLITNFF